MIKTHCDLCDRDMSSDENTTTVTWKDNNGYDYEFGVVFRKKRKFKADICDECISLPRKKVIND